MAAIAVRLQGIWNRRFGSAHLGCLSRAPLMMLIASLKNSTALGARISDVLRIWILACCQISSWFGSCSRCVFYDLVILGVSRLTSIIGVSIYFLLELYLFLVSILHSLFVWDLAHLRQRHLQSEARSIYVYIGRRLVETWHVRANIHWGIVGWLRRICYGCGKSCTLAGNL